MMNISEKKIHKYASPKASIKYEIFVNPQSLTIRERCGLETREAFPWWG